MKLYIDKCKVLTITQHKSCVDYKYGLDTRDSVIVELERVNNMKDLGVTIDSSLNFKDHIYDKIKKAYHMLGIINRNLTIWIYLHSWCCIRVWSEVTLSMGM